MLKLLCLPVQYNACQVDIGFGKWVCFFSIYMYVLVSGYIWWWSARDFPSRKWGQLPQRMFVRGLAIEPLKIIHIYHMNNCLIYVVPLPISTQTETGNHVEKLDFLLSNIIKRVQYVWIYKI